MQNVNVEDRQNEKYIVYGYLMYIREFGLSLIVLFVCYVCIPTCLDVLPPGSVTGVSVIIDWLDFVPTTKLLLPGITF